MAEVKLTVSEVFISADEEQIKKKIREKISAYLLVTKSAGSVEKGMNFDKHRLQGRGE